MTGVEVTSWNTTRYEFSLNHQAGSGADVAPDLGDPAGFLIGRRLSAIADDSAADRQVQPRAPGVHSIRGASEACPNPESDRPGSCYDCPLHHHYDVRTRRGRAQYRSASDGGWHRWAGDRLWRAEPGP